MAEASVAPLERAQKLAGTAAVVAMVAAVTILVGAVGRDVAAPALSTLRSELVTPDWRGALMVLRTIGAFSVLAAPSLWLAGGLFELGRVLDEYGKGQFFTLKASAGIRKAAEFTLLALAFELVISPTVFSWIMGEGRGLIWHVESFNLGLVAFAAFVMVLGRVLEAAACIKAENDEIV